MSKLIKMTLNIFQITYFKNYLFLFVIIFVCACKKDNDLSIPNPKLDINSLKGWYSANASIVTNNGNWLNTLAPNWAKVELITSNDTVKIYEINLLNPANIFVITKDISITQAADHLSGNTQFRLLVFANLKNGSISSSVMEITTFKDPSNLSNVHYKSYQDFSGMVNFYELTGKFANGWILNDGDIIREASTAYKIDYNLLQTGNSFVAGKGKIMLADVSTVSCGRALIPHTRTVCIGTGGLDGWGYDGSGGGMNCRQETYYVSEVQYCEIPEGQDTDGGYTGGGGGGSTGNGNNTNSDPDCVKVKANSSTAAYKEKVEDLKGKTNLKKETGFEEKKDGSFNTASNAGDNSLNANPDANTKGYIHTHLNSYMIQESESTLAKVSPIRMISPADVSTLMNIIDQNRNSGDFSSFYVSMVSSYGHYMIKFNGSVDDIKMGFGGEDWKKKYIDFMNKYNNLEKGFLKFLNEEMGINGVKLYEIKNNGEVKTIELKPDGKSVDKKDC